MPSQQRMVPDAQPDDWRQNDGRDVCTCRHPSGGRCVRQRNLEPSVTIENEGQMRSTCVPSPFAHIGKAINWQIFPDSTTCVRHITWAKSRGPQGEREREKSIDNSRQHSSKVTDSARGCTVQSNMARSTSQTSLKPLLPNQPSPSIL